MLDLFVLEFGLLASFVRSNFCTPYFVAFLLVIFLLEQVRPAETGKRFHPKAMLYDAILGFVALLCQFLISNVVLLGLFSLYEMALPRLLAFSNDWTSLWRAAVALIIGDFLNWCSHLVRHKIGFLWRLHALHHSQQHMNVFTEFRAHPLDIVINSALQSVPLYLLYVPFEMSVAATVLFNYYLMFVHANIDLSYGRLDKILVSPAFHRTHHAIGAEFHDRNYGAVLSIWDTIFGTAVHRRGGIATGVPDFPSESHGSAPQAIRTFGSQLAFPFSRRAK